MATTIATCRSSKTTDLVEKLRAQKVAFEAIATLIETGQVAPRFITAYPLAA